MSRIHFARPDEFDQTLRRRVHAHLEARGLPRHGGARIIAKALTILALLAGSYLFLLFVAANWWQVLIGAFALSQAIVLVGFNIMHDGGHGSFSNRSWLNRAAARSVDLVGGNADLWRTKHGVLHHSYTNIDQWDDDLETGGLMRFHPSQPWRPMHRFQWLYAVPLYSMLSLHWYVSDFREFFSGQIGGRHATKPHGARTTAVFLLFKALFLFLGLVLPLMLHPVIPVLATFLGTMMVVGVIISVVFQLAHVVDAVEMPELDGGQTQLERSWAVHQLATTANFAPRSALVNWYAGGLNHQVEHHLFARISHLHYREIAPIVQATCAEYGVPYHSYDSVASAVRAHLRHLRRMGRRPSEAGEAESITATATELRPPLGPLDAAAGR